MAAKKKTASKTKATKKKAAKRKAAPKKKAAKAAASASGAPPKKVRTAETLIIVESPAKARTIEKYLGPGHVVIASKGHIKDLPKRGGVDVEHGFQETYDLIAEKGTQEVLRSIKHAARYANRVLLATDPDREGEAIAYHLADEVRDVKPDLEVRRVLFNEITKKGVAEGVADPRDLDANLYEAQRTRRVLDRIGGYPLSNLLWRKLAFGLSAGRVQTPALRILVDRQHEIDAFVPRPYWLLQARLQGSKPPPFIAALDSVNGEKLEKVSSRPAATSELDARRFEEDLKRADYRVAKVTKRERKGNAPAPYTTSKLQQDAANRISMQPKRAMRTAQQLYEGIALGRGNNAETVGLITYMRTDSVRVSTEAVSDCRAHIAERFGKDAVPEKPNEYKTKKQNVQDAHEAIRPTRMDLPPESIRQFLTDDRYKLYKLIWDRFVACQMKPAIYDQTSVEIEASADDRKYGLRASGSILRYAGWRAAYGAESAGELAGQEASSSPSDDATTLPPLEENESLRLLDLDPSPEAADEGTGEDAEKRRAEAAAVQVQAKQTEPPPHYSEASLVKKLEEEGLGRPSTYAEIISKVQARDYVRKEGTKLVPTPLGKLVVERLVANNFDLADVAFTRRLEEGLDAVAEARAKRLDILAPFHERLQKQIEASLGRTGKWWPEPEDIGEECPECGKKLHKRWGRNGQFIGCEGYPDCKYTRPVLADGEVPQVTVQETDYKCEECGAPMLKRLGRNGWFLGCSTYPKCKSTRNVPLDIDCPKCGGEVVEIRSRKSKRPFYGCGNYKKTECDFRLWQKPHAIPCPKCKAKFLVEVPATQSREAALRCVTEDCGHTQPLPAPEPSQPPSAAAAS